MTQRILLVGAGGIGCPVALTLAAAHARGELSADATLTVLDDDLVEVENLHRQILFDDADVGAPKVDALARQLRARAPGLRVNTVRERLLPDTAAAFASGVDVVVDASDNFPTRFLVADAGYLAGTPVVSAASIRSVATVMLGLPGAACYRCVFEDLPDGDAPDCATAGILGPVCGVAGAIAADLALRVLAGRATEGPNLFSFDGRADKLRALRATRRASCALSGDAPTVRDVDASRYVAAACAADQGAS